MPGWRSSRPPRHLVRHQEVGFPSSYSHTWKNGSSSIPLACSAAATKLGRRDVAVPVLLRPAPHQREERRVADLLAQRLQRHCAAVVDRPVEQEAGVARIARRRVPEQRVLRRGVVELLEPLVGGLVALVLAPDPLRPRGEALVQPDVRPHRERDRVAEPHVRELVHERRLVRHPVEVRLRLRLERVADDLRVVDDRADRVERVGAVDRRVEGERLRDQPQDVPLRQRRVDRDVVRHAAGEGADREVEAAECRGREVRRHRDALAPDPGAPSAGRRVRYEHAVGHHGEAVRHGDAEGVGRLVARVVVRRVPRRRALRLVDDEGAVRGRYPALDRPVRIRHHRRRPRVVDRDGQRLACLDPGGRRDDELLAVPRERSRASVHEQPGDVEAAEVEVEAGQVLGRGRSDDRGPAQQVLRRLVVEGQVVVADVVPAVPREREERIAETGRARRERRGSGAAGRECEDERGHERRRLRHGSPFVV